MDFDVETYILMLLITGTVFLLLGLLFHLKTDDHKEQQKYHQSVGNISSPIFHQQETAPQQAPTAPLESPHEKEYRNQVEVDIHTRNPQFFKKKVYLYFDHDPDNIYTGEERNFEINEISNIKRVGLGTLSYNGTEFKFYYQNRDHTFKMDELDHIALYPNCLVLVSQKDIPTALLFVDETETIRKLLNIFKA